MTLQTIYFYAGVAGFCLFAIFAIAAVVYFMRVDIRGVIADLSGKKRKTDMAKEPEVIKRRRAKNVLTKDDEWQGKVSRGSLSKKGSGALSDSLTDEEDSTTGSGSLSCDTAVEENDGKAAEAGDAFSVAPSVEAAENVGALPEFKLVRRVVAVHSPMVIDASSNEVPVR